MTGRLLTARAVAQLLDVSAETVLRWTRRGLLPAVKLPSGAVRYREADLEEWLAARAVGRADGADEECDQPDAPAAPRQDRSTRLRPVTNLPPVAGA